MHDLLTDQNRDWLATTKEPSYVAKHAHKMTPVLSIGFKVKVNREFYRNLGAFCITTSNDEGNHYQPSSSYCDWGLKQERSHGY